MNFNFDQYQQTFTVERITETVDNDGNRSETVVTFDFRGSIQQLRSPQQFNGIKLEDSARWAIKTFPFNVTDVVVGDKIIHNGNKLNVSDKFENDFEKEVTLIASYTS